MTLQHNVPFPCGTKVRPKHGPNRKFEWTVYDHHGITWEQGEDVNRVVLVRPVNTPDSYPDDTTMLVTTWGRIEAV